MKFVSGKTLFILFILCLLGAVTGIPAHAQVYFPNDATIDYSISAVYVGFANYDDFANDTNPTNPTIDIVTGGNITGYLDAFNSSTINVSGGNITGNLEASANSTINVSGGSTYRLEAGTNNPLVTGGSSTINVSGGSILVLSAGGNTTINVSGGSTGILGALFNSTLNFYGHDLVLRNPTPVSRGIRYTLSGFLADGTNVTGTPVYLYDQAKTNLRVVQITIDTPQDNAKPNSDYVALTGTDSVGTKATLVDLNTGKQIAAVSVDADGTWQKLAYVGSGSHTLVLEDSSDPSIQSDPIHITNSLPPGTLGCPLNGQVDYYTKMRIGDVILAVGNGSLQPYLDGAHYTHAAVYLGGDSQGTPLIGEAVRSVEARGLGEVRAAPLELSLVFWNGKQVDFYHVHGGELTLAQAQALVAWSNYLIPRSQGYWQPNKEWSVFVSSIFFWNLYVFSLRANMWALHEFQLSLQALDNCKTETSHLICSTLVYQAYGYGLGIDVSQPNRMPLSGILRAIAAPGRNSQAASHYVFPDTLALSGQLDKR